ncbi:MAG TPA: TonB-dependent receptor, partial [Saprospiraceae bacterium]|nr:TonB-dependent receptor [Saprospiraceae bacterium]
NFAEKSNFFLWKDSRKHAYEPSPGSISSGKYLRYMIDPVVTFIPNNDTKHVLQSRIHYVDNQNNNDQGNKSTATYIEYQFQKKINPLKLNVVLGTAYQNVNTTAELFDGETISSHNLGIYGQLDKKFGDKLSLSAGLRYEYFKDKSPKEYLGVSIPDGRIEDGDLIMRFGANYKLAEYTSLRASYGQGYRFPTITERFISTTFSSFSILPNPLLNPEKGWTAEIGVKQGFKIFGMKGIADIAVFDSRYFDMIEFTFLQTDMFSFGFKPLNIGDTRIKGIDLGLGGQWEHKDWKTTIFGGITFINPTYTNFDSNPEIKNTLSTDENVLKYRSKQFYKFDLEISYLKFSLGGAIRYASNQINVDKAFETGGQLNSDIFEIKYWRSFHNMGYHLIDFRVSYELNRIAKLSLFLNNAFNEEYSLRPGLLEAPVNSSVRLDVKF